MSKEITFILEPDRGKLATEVSGISPDVLTDLRDDLGASQNVNCGISPSGSIGFIIIRSSMGLVEEA